MVSEAKENNAIRLTNREVRGGGFIVCKKPDTVITAETSLKVLSFWSRSHSTNECRHMPTVNILCKKRGYLSKMCHSATAFMTNSVVKKQATGSETRDHVLHLAAITDSVQPPFHVDIHAKIAPIDLIWIGVALLHHVVATLRELQSLVRNHEDILSEPKTGKFFGNKTAFPECFVVASPDKPKGMNRRTLPPTTCTELPIFYKIYVRPILEYTNRVVFSERKKNVIFIECNHRVVKKMIASLKPVAYKTWLPVFDIFSLENRLRVDLILNYALLKRGLVKSFLPLTRLTHGGDMVKLFPGHGTQICSATFILLRVVDAQGSLPIWAVQFGTIKPVDLENLVGRIDDWPTTAVKA
ncbi:hypothetical protein CLF_108973 [Clonorchis sinensis]|uniref:Uncharacterized protein n=1 Tax=Clonorchis sinensis TaxID=79923 RepID=G7YIS6_CLOSI|nr:hypothetical protein CLF_108973 [Clonorchis sinensis]